MEYIKKLTATDTLVNYSDVETDTNIDLWTLNVLEDEFGYIYDEDVYAIDFIAGHGYHIDKTSFYNLSNNRPFPFDWSIYNPDDSLNNTSLTLGQTNSIYNGVISLSDSSIDLMAEQTGTYYIKMSVFSYKGTYYQASYDDPWNYTVVYEDLDYDLGIQDLGYIDSGNETVVATFNENGHYELDTSIYTKFHDLDRFSFTADPDKDYSIKVTTLDGVSKGIWWWDPSVFSGLSTNHVTEKILLTDQIVDTEYSFKITGDVGDYKIEIQEVDVDAEGNTIAQAQTLVDGGEAIDAQLFGGYKDKDYYGISLVKDEIYEINIEHTTLNSESREHAFRLEIHNPDGSDAGYTFYTPIGDYLHTNNALKTVTDTGLKVSFKALETGDFYLDINSFYTSGEYSISYNTYADLYTVSTIAEATNTDSIAVNTNYNSEFFSSTTQTDVYKINLTSGNIYEMKLDSKDVKLMKADGMVVASDQGFGWDFTYAPTESGDYFLEFSGGTYKKYSFNVNQLDANDDRVDDTLGKATQITLDSGRHKISGVMEENDLDSDFYKFTPESGKAYKFGYHDNVGDWVSRLADGISGSYFKVYSNYFDTEMQGTLESAKLLQNIFQKQNVYGNDITDGSKDIFTKSGLDVIKTLEIVIDYNSFKDLTFGDVYTFPGGVKTLKDGISAEKAATFEYFNSFYTGGGNDIVSSIMTMANNVYYQLDDTPTLIEVEAILQAYIDEDIYYNFGVYTPDPEDLFSATNDVISFDALNTELEALNANVPKYVTQNYIDGMNDRITEISSALSSSETSPLNNWPAPTVEVTTEQNTSISTQTQSVETQIDSDLSYSVLSAEITTISNAYSTASLSDKQGFEEVLNTIKASIEDDEGGMPGMGNEAISLDLSSISSSDKATLNIEVDTALALFDIEYEKSLINKAFDNNTYQGIQGQDNIITAIRDKYMMTGLPAELQTEINALMLVETGDENSWNLQVLIDDTMRNTYITQELAADYTSKTYTELTQLKTQFDSLMFDDMMADTTDLDTLKTKIANEIDYDLLSATLTTMVNDTAITIEEALAYQIDLDNIKSDIYYLDPTKFYLTSSESSTLSNLRDTAQINVDELNAFVAPEFYVEVYNGLGSYEFEIVTEGDDYIGESITNHDSTRIDNYFTTTAILESATDKDWYKASLNANNTYAVTFSESALNANDANSMQNIEVKIFDSSGLRVIDGVNVDVKNSTLIITAQNSADYFVELSNKSDVGQVANFKVNQISVADDFGNNINGAKLYNDMMNDSQVVEGSINFKGDQDWIRIDTAPGSYYNIELDHVTDGDNLQLNVKLYNADGSVYYGKIAKDYQVGVLEANKIDSKVSFLAEETSYYIQVDSYKNSGDYTLKVSEDTTQDDFGSSVQNVQYFSTIDANDANPHDGIITGSIELSGDKDWFAVDLDENNLYKFHVSGDNQFMKISMIDTNGDLVTNNWNEIFADSSLSTKGFYFSPEETTTYFLEATNFSRNANYTITTTEIAGDSNNDNFGGATLLDISSGLASIDGALTYKDHDWHKVYLESGEVYEITTESDDLIYDSKIKIYDLYNQIGIETNLLSEWNPSDVIARSYFTPTQSQYYWVDIYDGSHDGLELLSSANGGYTLNVGILDLDIDDDYGSSVLTSENFNDIDSDNDGSIDGVVNSKLDRDYFNYDFIDGKSYKISVNSTDSDSINVLLRNKVKDEKTGEHKTSFKDQIWDTNSQIYAEDKTIILNYQASDDISILVRDDIESTYTLNIEELNPSDDYSADINTTATAQIDTTFTSLIENKTDEDWIKLSLDAGNIYKINVKGSLTNENIDNFVAIAGLYDSAGNYINGTTAKSLKSGETTTIYYEVQSSGDYFVDIKALDVKGTYGIYELDVSGTSNSDAISADINTSSTLTLENKKDSQIDYFYDKDWHKVTLTADKSYQFDVLGNTLENSIIGGIYDSNGTFIANTYNDNASLITLDAKTVLTAETSGDYFIEVKSDSNATGSYSVNVKEIDPASIDADAETTALSDSNNTTVTATNSKVFSIENSSIDYVGDTDWFAYELEEGVTYNFNMAGLSSESGTLFNTYINGIYNSLGQKIENTNNARGGSGNDAKVTFTAEESGTFYLEAASLYEGLGSYTVNVVENHSTVDGKIEAIEYVEGQDSWNFMYYIAGDNNLEEYALENINQLEKLDLPDNINITFFIDRSEDFDTSDGNWTESRYGIISQDLDENSINSPMESIGEQNTGDGNTVTNFINWSSEIVEADNYALIIFDHGGGISGVAFDDDSKHDGLGIEELTSAIETSNIDKFDVVGFDTCLQGIADQFYALKDVSEYVYASEEVAWSDYFDKEKFFDTFVNIDSFDGADVAKGYVEMFQNYDEEGRITGGRDITGSAVDSTKIEAVVTAVGELNDSFGTLTNDEQSKIKTLAQDVVTFGGSGKNMDIGAFASMIDSLDIGEDALDGLGSSVDSKAKAVLEALDAAVIANYTNMQGKDGEYAQGISMYANGGYSSSEYLANFELGSLMNMNIFYEIA
jgi:hypothetical protein